MIKKEFQQQLHHKVMEQLRSAIINGRFRPGEWLRQIQIAEELGVSQMPVREALKELAAEGLLEHVPYRGVRVLEFSPQDIADLYAHRAFLEGRAASFAAIRLTTDQLEELGRLQTHMNLCSTPETLAEYRQLNRQFHQLIYTASQHNYLIRALDQLWGAFPTMLWGNYAKTAESSLPIRDQTDPGEHDAIITALKNRDATLADHLMQQHILNAGSHFTAALKAQ